MMLTEHGLVPCLDDDGQAARKGIALVFDQTRVGGLEIKHIDPPPREWIVRRRIPKGEVTLFSGQGGLGKSMLAVQLQLACAAGQDWLGYQTRQCRSLGILCEENYWEAVRRFKTAQRRLGVSYDDVEAHVQFHSLKGETVSLVDIDRYTDWCTASDFLVVLQGEVERRKVDLLVLDSLNRMFVGNENNRVQVTGFLRELERFATETGAAVLLLAHPSKSGMIDGNFYSGSTAWDSMVRSRCFLHIPTVANPELLTEEELRNPVSTLVWAKGNYAGDLDRIELRRSPDPDDDENPPIWERMPEPGETGEDMFLAALRDLHANEILPRPTATGASKHLFAAVLVYQHPSNRDRRRAGQRPLTSEQCLNLYRKLMAEGRIEVVEMRNPGDRHMVKAVREYVREWTIEQSQEDLLSH